MSTATNPGLRVIWFDIDDTIFDFRTNSLHALRAIWDQYTLSRFFPSPQNWIDRYHFHNNALWEAYAKGNVDQARLRFERFTLPLTDAGVHPEEAARLSRQMDPRYLDVLARGTARIPDAEATLAHLSSRGYLIGVLSNGFEGTQQQKLHTAGLWPYIRYVVLSDHIGVNKPHPAIFRHAMEISGIPEPASHLMVGDNPVTDVEGALNAGWQGILYDPGHKYDTHRQATAVSTLYEICNIIDPHRERLPRPARS